MPEQLDIFGALELEDCLYPWMQPYSAYQKGCRCLRCKEGNRIYAADSRARNPRQFPPCLLCGTTHTHTTAGNRHQICTNCRHGFNKTIVRHRLNTEQAIRLIQLTHCESCNQELRYADNHRGRAVEVDHDHAHCPGPKGCEECVRGFICKRCNRTAAALEHPSAPAVMAYLAAWKLTQRDTGSL